MVIKMNNTDYELILCIVNTGFSDTVMSAAKEVGARGGTVINARGTANKDAEEFFHVTIQPEKEIVMILVPSDIRDAVLHAVYQAAGLKTAGQGISFALPVTNVVGLTTAPAPDQKQTDDGKKQKKPDKRDKAEDAATDKPPAETAPAEADDKATEDKK